VQASNNIAFKEWAAVCAALAAGRQTVILRKGGIDEGREGFRVAHSEFWLLPTRFHQDASQLTADGEPFWQQSQAEQPPGADFDVCLYAVVEKVYEVANLAALQKLSGLHILADATVEQRFHYRRPGLFVLVVRVYQAERARRVADSPYIAGCKSWVELPQSLPTADLHPVLNPSVFANQLQQIEQCLTAAK
jgi:hypothetical protein